MRTSSTGLWRFLVPVPKTAVSASGLGIPTECGRSRAFRMPWECGAPQAVGFPGHAQQAPLARPCMWSLSAHKDSFFSSYIISCKMDTL